ncbi:hypothetical protein BH20ACT15_BH20ACT15_07180 [soil metagenome]
MPESFFEPAGAGGLFEATELTRGPWDPGAQHAGPPAALIGREIERIGKGRIGGPDGHRARVGRVTYEVMRSVPIGPVRVSAEVLRPGRRVEMVGASLTDADGVELMRAQGWRIRTDAVEFDAPPGLSGPPPPPSEAEHRDFFPTGHDVSYPPAMK